MAGDLATASPAVVRDGGSGQQRLGNFLANSASPSTPSVVLDPLTRASGGSKTLVRKSIAKQAKRIGEVGTHKIS